MFFNAHHSPIGAFASFTFGMKGRVGGLGLELGRPADENLYIGYETEQGVFHALPFFEQTASKAQDYDVEAGQPFSREQALWPFADEAIRRTFKASTDTWTAQDMVFRVISPVGHAPHPDEGGAADAYCPAVLAELTIDNRGGTFEKRAFFGYAGSDPYAGMRFVGGSNLIGIGQGTRTAIVTNSAMVAGLGWQPEDVLDPILDSNLGFMLGSLGMLVGRVPAGECKTFRFAVCFFGDGSATSGLATKYLHNRWFSSLEAVGKHALAQFDATVSQALELDEFFRRGLTPIQEQTVAHAVRSYYGSTQLLEDEAGKPLWVVNEGEYRMMNTLDLTADQVFYELEHSPWTVRNELEWFRDRFSYQDTVRLPNDPKEYAGGLSFCHDMGVSNGFSGPGYSSYEKAGIHGCFSYMTSEELLNWVLCACLYALKTGDGDWTLSTLEACLESLVNRDHPEPSKRRGAIGADSNRCEGGSEITTYDSLDASLGQTRDNLYIAGKCWAAYYMLSRVLSGDSAALAQSQANLAVDTILSVVGEDGQLPALLPCSESRIIPVIEGLIWPLQAGFASDIDARLLHCFETHLRSVLKPGVCLFSDGGWKLSSTSDNSWLSKIYLCMHVAKELFGIEDPVADQAHWDWLVRPENTYYAWSDQMLAGKAVGSRYYPRGVTSTLWLKG